MLLKHFIKHFKIKISGDRWEFCTVNKEKLEILKIISNETTGLHNNVLFYNVILYAIVLLIEVCRFGNVKTLGPHKIVKILNFSATQSGV